MDAGSAGATRFTRAPTRGLTANQCGVRVEGATATGTSEAGSHRITAGEQPAAGWTGPPKRGRRRETPPPRASSGRETSPGWGIVGRTPAAGARLPRERASTGARSRVCGWQSVGGAHLACAKVARPEQTLAPGEAGERSTPRRGSEGDRVRRGLWWLSKQGPMRSRSTGRKARRGPHDGRRLGFVSTFAPHRGGRTASLGPWETARTVARKGRGTGGAGDRSQEPALPCPRVTRAGRPLHRKVNVGPDAETPEIGRCFGKGSSSR